MADVRVGRSAATRLRRSLLLVPVLLATLLTQAASAQVASFAIGITIQGPATVTVGDQNHTASIGLINNSAGIGPITLTSITYHPSCQSLDLACPSAEPGVFSLSPVAVGSAGTSCGDRVFTTTADGTGRYSFATSPAIVLASGANCTINFTFSVLRMPSTDAVPASPGVQTTRNVTVSGSGTATGGGTVTGTSRGLSTITVVPFQPTITTQVTSSVVGQGSPMSDTATVTGAPGVAVTGTVTFNLYGPNDPTCTAIVFTSTVVVAGNTATSATFTPTVAGTYRFKATYNGDANNLPVGAACNAANESVDVLPAGRYEPLTPSRILDTRTGTGGIVGPVGPGGTVNVQITGRGGVPVSGVSAVVLNVTATQPTAPSYLAIYPTGSVRPLAANLNFVANQTIPNLVVAKLGAGGKVDLYNSAGSVYVIFDVAGYYTDGPTGGDGRYQPVDSARIIDTRFGTGTPQVRIGPGASLDIQVAGQGGIPATGVEAVVMNVVVTNVTAPSFLTVFPAGEALPLAANLNWVAGDVAGNRVFAKLGTGGKVTLYNSAGLADIIVDVNGWFTNGVQATTGSAYVPLTPARIVDTRFGVGAPAGPRPAGSILNIQVAGQGGVPASGVSAVILNVTSVSPAAPGFLTLFAAGQPLPLASDLNYTTNEVRPNLVVVKVGTGGQISLYTPSSVHVVIDVAGFYT